MIANSNESKTREFGSGDIVEPGVYVDVETGATVQINEADELPTGNRLVTYRRRFRQVASLSEAVTTSRDARELVAA